MAEVTGGTTSNLCEITPSDLAGNVDNIATRLARLEQIVAELLGVDVSADQLSDISEDLGWVTGITYLGTEGWTQTPSGTLIPPPGWDGLSGILDGTSGTVVSAGTGRACTHRKGASSGDISTGTSFYLNLATAMANDDDADYYGTTYFTPGQTDGAGHVGWECQKAGVYDFFLNVGVIDGSSAPTTGALNAKIYKRDTSYSTLAIQGFGVPPGGIGSYGVYLSMAGRRKLAAGDFINVNVNNGTDGDIVAYQSELVAILSRTV